MTTMISVLRFFQKNFQKLWLVFHQWRRKSSGAAESGSHGLKEWHEILDKKVLNSLSIYKGQSGAGLLDELVVLFDAEMKEGLRRMENALVQKDIETIRREAHVLKSASGNLGALRVAEIFEKLEHSENEGADELLQSAKLEIVRAKEGLMDYLEIGPNKQDC